MALVLKLITDNKSQQEVKDELNKIKRGQTEYSFAGQAFLKDRKKRTDEAI